MGCCLSCKPRQLTEGRILFLGPMGSGKTVTMYYLKFGEPVSTIATHGCNVETINYYNKQYEVWDVGGCIEDRDVFLDYTTSVTAIVFFIDCSKGKKGLSVAMKRLELMLSEENLHYCPVAIVANKQDVAKADITIETITEAVTSAACMAERHWNVFPCSGLYGEGLSLMLQWLQEYNGRYKNILEVKRLVTLKNDKDKLKNRKKKKRRKKRGPQISPVNLVVHN